MLIGGVAPDYFLRAQGTTMKLHDERSSPMDLELGGEIAGAPRGATRYVTRDDLLALPQVNDTVTDDSNFAGPTKISGVALATLISLFGAQGADLVIAICKDKYRANYPPDYVATHHPLLVLEVNGHSPSGWPKYSGEHGADMGPFMISHAKFTPSFKILEHEDEAQIPWGVVRIEFRDEKKVFGPIAPRGPGANDAAVQDGFKIAQQNCFRCHNTGDEGGQKSGVTWTVLAAMAAGSPDFFTGYVRNPASKNPKTQMAKSPQYDDATMRALIDYFKTFAPGETH
jgi:mono/diheme cytochrome c family protein